MPTPLADELTGSAGDRQIESHEAGYTAEVGNG